MRECTHPPGTRGHRLKGITIPLETRREAAKIENTDTKTNKIENTDTKITTVEDTDENHSQAIRAGKDSTRNYKADHGQMDTAHSMQDSHKHDKKDKAKATGGPLQITVVKKRKHEDATESYSSGVSCIWPEWT